MAKGLVKDSNDEAGLLNGRLKSAEHLGWNARRIALFSKRSYHTIAVFVQEIIDFLTILLGNSLAYAVYLELNIGRHHIDPPLYWKLNVLTSLITVLIFARMGLYRETVGLLGIEETRRLIKAIFYATAAVVVGSFFVREYSFSRFTAALAVPTNMALFYLQRWMMSMMHGKLHQSGFGVRRCLIVGAGEMGCSIAARCLRNPRLGWIPVGFLVREPGQEGQAFRVTPGPKGQRLDVLGHWDDLHDVAQRYEISDVIVVMLPQDKDMMEKYILNCRDLRLHCHLIPVHAHQPMFSYTLSNLDGLPILSPKEDDSRAYDVLKALFDRVVAAALMVIGLPFYLFISLMIKLDSSGPVLFRQRRIGLNGQEFVMYKYRTMYEEVPPYSHCPNSHDDPRITKVGRFLRRTSLDELPQLLNVLRGEMSLVGPRPEMPFIVSTYTDVQRQRLKAKPGITGLWQISGDRAFQIHENLEYDLYYISNRSFSLDLAILFHTMFSVLRGTGAW